MRSHLARLALLAVVAGAVSAQAAGAARGKPALAGPWYTPAELSALIAYSNAPRATPTGSRTRVLAGPSYTPEELNALKAYAAASFEGRKALLDGRPATSVTADAFDWGDAGIGAVGAAAAIILAGGSAVAGRRH